MPTVKFLPEGKRVVVPVEATLLEAALKAGVDVTSLCSGRGTCGKCKVIVVEGYEGVTPLSDVERCFLSEEELKSGLRLTCQARVLSDVAVKVPEYSRTGRQRLVILGYEPPLTLKPCIKKVYVRLEEPSLGRVEADDSKLLAKLFEVGEASGDARLSYNAARKLADALRDGDWRVTVTLWNNAEVINVEPGDTRSKVYGYAVDIGTTKIAGFLVDLISGALIHAGGVLNPQIPYGEDVMSRITYAMQSRENLERLKNEALRGVNELLTKACKVAGIPSEQIYEVVIVGNTAMHHLFLGLNPKHLALNPYPPVVKRPLTIKASELGLRVNREAYIYALPNVAGFVGADAVSSIIATELYEKKDPALLIDVGTNTEIILGCNRFMMACSTASGPTFEGAHIRFGMRAATGAIETVNINKGGLDVAYNTIDGAKPRGLCGSGIIDAVAGMLKEGVIDTAGRIQPNAENPRIRVRSKEAEYVIAWMSETATGVEDIVITQSDVREVQKAKAAIQAGWRILMKKAGVNVEDLSEVLIAGAFGTYINPASAKTIGMLPEVPEHSVRFVGNTAGSGARMALKSADIRRTAEEVVRKIDYVELATRPDFEVEYINAMVLPHSDYSIYPETMKRIKAPRTSRIYRGLTWMKAASGA